MNPSFVLQWLREQGFKEIETIEKKHRENDYEGVVFVDEMQFKELLNHCRTCDARNCQVGL